MVAKACWIALLYKTLVCARTQSLHPTKKTFKKIFNSTNASLSNIKKMVSFITMDTRRPEERSLNFLVLAVLASELASPQSKFLLRF